MAKRIFDLIFSSIGLILLSPLFLLLCLLIRIDSPGPVFFRQVRVGKSGVIFRIHKFRTMVKDAQRRGLQITVGADPRVTRVGRWLRKLKLDELPQLLDVWTGHMSFVGPRPEVPQYVSLYPAGIRDLILSVRPGITDLASIKFKDENLMLRDSIDPHATYVDQILPVKCKYYLEYVRDNSVFGDIVIILATIRALIL